jgi:PQQ-like domain
MSSPMSATHVVVRSRRPAAAPLAPERGLFDVVVDGVNITARLGEGPVAGLLAELGRAVVTLASGRRERVSVQHYADHEAWEIGLEADANDVLISVFRSGSPVEVAVYERRVALNALCAAVLRALDEASERRLAPAAALTATRSALERARSSTARAQLVRAPTEIAPIAAGGVAFTAETELRTRVAGAPDGSSAHVERADLHALLARGEITLRVRGRTASLGSTHLFAFAETLLELGDQVLECWQGARPIFRRSNLERARLEVRLTSPDAPLTLIVTAPGGERASFGDLAPAGFVSAAARFARALADAFVRADPSQATNLRLAALRAAAASLDERADDAAEDDTLTNPEPESYRSFFSPRRRAETDGRWEHGGKMRFVPRWVATVPRIDLRGTFLCGDRLIVGSARETACLDRASGGVLWRAATPGAASVVTPSGLARIFPDGRVVLHDLETGLVRFSARLRPRTGGGARGAVVHAPGLPKLLIVAEGDRHITALDLVSGEVRWRHTARRAGDYRLRRAGKLLLVAGHAALAALDVQSGDVVWRVRDRRPFSGEIIVDHDAAFAVTGAASGTAKLIHLDALSGEPRWTSDVESRPAPGQPPLVTPSAVVVPTRDERGAGAAAYDRVNGDPLWEQPPGFSAAPTAWLAIDDAIVANSAAGTLLSVGAADGQLLYNHVFSRHIDADLPRRLEPVLRSGALFVPQHQVHVVRPRDGELLGTLPCDLIPDLLRVDERCDVYVAEESGHVAAFGAAPRLALVKS